MKKKILAGVLACILLIGIGVGGTLAWLTAQTTAVTNTFTVGKIQITLDEAPVGANGKETTGDRVIENKYSIIPGDQIDKDPTVHVIKDSENCYVYVCIDDALNATNVGKCATYTVADTWEQVGKSGNKTVYKYKTIVTTSGADQDLLVFDGVTISGDMVTKDNINLLKDQTIKVTAYAHQSDNTTGDAATTAALAHFGIA